MNAHELKQLLRDAADKPLEKLGASSINKLAAAVDKVLAELDLVAAQQEAEQLKSSCPYEDQRYFAHRLKQAGIKPPAKEKRKRVEAWRAYTEQLDHFLKEFRTEVAQYRQELSRLAQLDVEEGAQRLMEMDDEHRKALGLLANLTTTTASGARSLNPGKSRASNVKWLRKLKEEVSTGILPEAEGGRESDVRKAICVAHRLLGDRCDMEIEPDNHECTLRCADGDMHELICVWRRRRLPSDLVGAYILASAIKNGLHYDTLVPVVGRHAVVVASHLTAEADGVFVDIVDVTDWRTVDRRHVPANWRAWTDVLAEYERRRERAGDAPCVA